MHQVKKFSFFALITVQYTLNQTLNRNSSTSTCPEVLINTYYVKLYFSWSDAIMESDYFTHRLFFNVHSLQYLLGPAAIQYFHVALYFSVDAMLLGDNVSLS